MIDKLNPNLRSIEEFDGKTRKRKFYNMTPADAYSILETIAQINGLEDHLVLVEPSAKQIRDEEEAEEIRTKTEEKIQSENKKRRFKKDWNKTDKKLIEIRGKRLFSKRQDYLSLLPENLPTEFSVKDVKESLKTEGKENSILKNVPIMIWVLCKMNLIIFTGKKGNLKLYKISDEK